MAIIIQDTDADDDVYIMLNLYVYTAFVDWIVRVLLV